MRFYKRISLKLLFISIILVIIFPLLILGDFQQDDFYISSLNNLNFNSSLSSIFSQFSNRPLAAIFFSILSIFFYSYEHFFLLNIILILFSCNFIIKALMNISFQDHQELFLQYCVWCQFILTQQFFLQGCRLLEIYQFLFGQYQYIF